MANEVGSASGLEDLFSKMVTFLTTDATLVGLSQEWAIMRQRRDNITNLLTDLTVSAGGYRTALQTCRHDSRSLNTDNIAANTAVFQSQSLSIGSSYVSWQLTTSREVTQVRLQAPIYSPTVQYMVRNFRLQYSDDGVVWTTALTVSSSPVYSVGEVKTFSVGSPGSHTYWKIIVDSVQSGTTIVSWQTMLLLEADDTVANQFGSEVIFKAPGNSASDEIFSGIRSEYDVSAGWYNLFVNGYTGFNASEESWFDQPGSLPGYGETYPLHVPMIPCWNTTMPYWFVASGRSFRFAVKVSTSYEGGYLGFILPYATPGQYPYPLAVGGSLVPYAPNRTFNWRYSTADARHGVYPGPGCDAFANVEGKNSSLYLRDTSGSWGYFGNRGTSNLLPDGIYGPTQSLSAPFAPSGAWRSVWPHCMNDQWTAGRLTYRECLGGGYILQPCILLQRAPSVQVFGTLEGTYIISGYDNAAENTATYLGNTVVVFQQAYRNTAHEFWALSLD